jgi:uncharacterized protein YbjT (DUF2867 family)
MPDSPVLVVGATGQLGGAIARKLHASGVPVRALARSADKLAPLAAAGMEIVAADLLDLAKVTAACRGASQIIATANNNMGRGSTSPMRVDVSAYQNLCAAARNTGVRRLIYVSFRGITSGESVDVFRLKWYIEDAIRRSGVPHVMLRPTAFMDVWIDQIFAPGIRRKNVATVFGDGTAVANYIAVEDVAAFAERILARDDIRNEIVEVGGPSDLSANDVVALLERRLGRRVKRRHVPLVALKMLPAILRPFNEVAARMVSLGHFAAERSRPFPSGRQAPSASASARGRSSNIWPNRSRRDAVEPPTPPASHEWDRRPRPGRLRLARERKAWRRSQQATADSVRPPLFRRPHQAETYVVQPIDRKIEAAQRRPAVGSGSKPAAAAIDPIRT